MTSFGNEGRKWANLGDAIWDGPGEHIAIEFGGPRNVTRVTYTEFRTRVTAIAAWLEGRTEESESVAIIGRNSPTWLTAFFAVMSTGRVAVPLSHKAPEAALRAMIVDANARQVLVDEASSIQPANARGLEVQSLASLPSTPMHSPLGRSRPTRPGDLAMILYTSGSTGGPKGVELSHGSHLWVQSVLLDGADDAGTVLVAAPLYHMNALSNAQTTLARGATLRLLPSFDADAFIDAIDEGATSVTGVPPMFALVLGRADETGHGPFDAVNDVFIGSAPASEQLLAAIEEAFPHARVAFRYGTSESGPIAFADHPDGLPTPRGSVGVPHPTVRLRLVDTQGQETPSGGVLEISCPGLMNGYRHRPDLSAAITMDGYYHTNDVFDVDKNGFFRFRRRSDDVLVVGGENIAPQAVAQVLESHPDVLQAAVVGIPDAVKGAKPWAEVVLRPRATVNGQDLRDFALAHLEPNAAPRGVFVVPRLPLSTSNKVDLRMVEARIVERLKTTSNPPAQA